MWSDAQVERMRAVIRERVAATLGDQTICTDCGATYATYREKCTADLAVPCPGFDRVDDVQFPIEREVFALENRVVNVSDELHQILGEALRAQTSPESKHE